MRQALYPILFLFLSVSGLSQVSSQSVPAKTSNASAIKLGESIEVRNLFPSGSDYVRKRKTFKKNRQVPKNFIGRRGKSKSVIQELEHLGTDPVLQDTNIQALRVEPHINIQGLGNDISPMDPTGDVGKSYYIQAVNVTEVGIFTKNGVLVQTFALADLWAPLGAFSAGDPIVLYDEVEKRWFLTEFTDPANLLIAVSSSPDPLGSYYVYSFSTPSFPDYPKYGIWPEALMLTTNESDGSVLSQYFLNKRQLINGEEEVSMQRIEIPGNLNTEAGFFVSTPVDIDGILVPEDIRPIAMKLDDSSWGSTLQDEVDLYRFDIDWEDPNNTSVDLTSIPLSNFDGFPCSVFNSDGFDCIPQSGERGLDGIPETIMNVPKLRSFGTHESLVLSFVTDVTEGENLSGIRWVELRKTDTSDWELYQEGTYAPDSLDRFMSSIAIDKKGNIALGYSVSSPETFPGLRFTGRLASDSLGIMTVAEYEVVEGLEVINSGGRFGDYAHMSVDPTDGLTFWFTSEYAGDGNLVTRTRITAFNLARDSSDLELVSILSPVNSNTLEEEEVVSVLVQNRGLNPIANFEVGFFLDQQFIETVSVPDTLLSDSTLVISFPTTVDLSEEGPYTFTVFVSHPLDENPLNDSLSQEIIHLQSLDAVLTLEAPETICQEFTTLTATLINNGADTLRSGALEVQLNGVLVDTLSWEGLIPFEESEDIPILLTSLVPDSNRVSITFIQANDGSESTLSNNVDSLVVIFDKNLSEYTLNLLTDEFPTETTWEITDELGEALAEGGPYFESETLLNIPICLPDSGCFTFTIFDFQGDGLCCGFGEGNYTFQGPAGDTLFSGTGEFSSQESHTFCGVPKDKPCTISANAIQGTDTTSGLTQISIEVAGGDPPYLFSLDGGENFQEDSIFSAVEPGEYIFMVMDSTGTCSTRDTIWVEILTSLETLDKEAFSFHIYPNPNSGYFTIEFTQPGIAKPSLSFEVIDSKGAIIQKRRMTSYDGVFKAPISLVAYAKGTYFIRIQGDQKIVKRVVVK